MQPPFRERSLPAAGTGRGPCAGRRKGNCRYAGLLAVETEAARFSALCLGHGDVRGGSLLPDARALDGRLRRGLQGHIPQHQESLQAGGTRSAAIPQGQPQQAVAEIEKETGDWEKLSGGALAYYALGRRQDSDAALNKLIATHQNDGAYQIAEVYAFRGETDKAFEWLDRGYRQHDPGTQELKTGLLVRDLRQDPRYAELLKQMRLPM